MNLTGEQLEVLAERCQQFRGSKAPGGYPGSLALCLVDAIQSTGVTYTSVENVRESYRSYRKVKDGDPETDGAKELLKTFNDLGGSTCWAEKIGNQNKTSTRAGAPLKAEAIRQAAELLDRAGITDTAKLRVAVDSPKLEKVKSEWLRIPGQSSGITWRYILMLAGVPGVKPDRMIIRFVAAALGLSSRRVKPDFAAEAILATAERLTMSPTDLDHAIWDWQRRQRSRSKE
jgi:hypothetical protein